MRKTRLTVDMDGVIANLRKEWIKRYNELYDDSLDYTKVCEWNWHESAKCGYDIYKLLDNPDLFANLPVIPFSREILYELSFDYEIFICTAAFNPVNVVPKYKWLQKHFKFIDEKNYVFTRNKSAMYSDYLLDDKADNFIGFVGQGILYDAPYNQSEVDLPRMKDWFDVKKFFNNQEVVR